MLLISIYIAPVTYRLVLKSENIIETLLWFHQTKRYNISVLLNVDVALVCIATWRNKMKSTKSQMFRFYIILVTNLSDAQK